MKLRTILQGLPAERLIAIANAWQLPLPAGVDPSTPEGHTKMVEYLYPRMQATRYFRAAFAKLTPQQQDAMRLLAVHGGELPLTELAIRCFDGDESLAESELRQLAENGFIYIESGEEPYAILPEGIFYHFEVGAHLSGFLGAILHKLPKAHLLQIAEQIFGSKTKALSREQLVRLLRRQLLDPDFLKQYIASLPHEEAQLLDILIEKNGYALYGDLLEARGRRRFDLTRTEQLNSLIGSRGLAYVVSRGTNKYADVVIIPRDIFFILQHDYTPDMRTLRELDALGASATEFSPAVVYDNSHLVLRDLVLLANFIHTQDIRVLTTGGVSKSDLRRALVLLSSGKSLKYATFLVGYLLYAKFLIQVGQFWKVSDAFLEALENPAHIYSDLFTWWLEVNDWNEAIPDGIAWEEEQRTRGFLGLIEIRHRVLEALYATQRDRWISYAKFEEMLLPQVVAVLLSSGEKWNEKLATQVGLRVLRAVITEPLSWLGLVVLGASEVDAFAEEQDEKDAKSSVSRSSRATQKGELALRLSDLGQSLFQSGAIRPREAFHEMSMEEFPLQYSAEWFFVQPNMEIVAPPDLRLDKLYFLTSFCRVRNVDVMTSFELSRETLRAALDRGVHPEEILDFLNQHSRPAVPETVKRLISDCSEKHGEALLGLAGGYLVSDQPAVIEEVRANPKLAPFIREVIGDKGMVFVPDVDLSKLAKEMRAAGLMPRLETGTVQATRDGRYHISISPEDLLDLIGLIRLVRVLEDELDADITNQKAAALAQKLEPEGGAFFALRGTGEAIANVFEKRLLAALQKMRDQIEEKYKDQLSRLVAKSVAHRGPTRYHYRGQNPAVERKDIIALLKFAADYELEAEIQYVKRNENEVTLHIYPKSFEGNRIYAYCVESDQDSMYSLDRILRAKL